MVGDNVLHLTKEDGKDSFLCGDDSTLMTVSSSEVLAGDYCRTSSVARLDEQDLAVVIGKIGLVDNLDDEGPQLECFVGCLQVKDQMEVADFTAATDKVQATQKLLADGEGCLPHLTLAILLKNPLKHIGNLDGVGEICLRGLVF